MEIAVDHNKIEQEVRLIALETTKIVFVQAGISEDGVRELRSTARERLSKGTLPGIHPALSDHYSAEIEEEVDRILGSIEKSVAGAWSEVRRASAHGS